MFKPIWRYKVINGKLEGELANNEKQDEILLKEMGFISHAEAVEILHGKKQNPGKKNEPSQNEQIFKDKDELEIYVKKRYGVDLDKRKSMANLLLELEALEKGSENGNSAKVHK